MNEKLIDVANEIINILNKSNLSYLEGLVILEIVKNQSLKQMYKLLLNDLYGITSSKESER